MSSEDDKKTEVEHPSGSAKGSREDEISTPKQSATPSPFVNVRIATGDEASRPSTSHRIGINGEPREGYEEGGRPPLPPRPSNFGLLSGIQKSPTNSLQVPKKASRPRLVSSATTALSLADTQTNWNADKGKESYAHSLRSTPSHRSFHVDTTIGQYRSYNESEGDSASVRSGFPSSSGATDAESILGDVLVGDKQSPSWKLRDDQVNKSELAEIALYDTAEPLADFNREFDEIEELDQDGANEGIE